MFNCSRIIFKSFGSGATLSKFHNVRLSRNLYSQAALGIDNYVKNRERVQNQFTNMLETFKTKMTEFSGPASMNMIFTEDLKNMIHLVEPNSDDVVLVVKMMVKFNKQNKDLRFGSFVFGPVVMRMFHYLDDPDAALKCFFDPDLSGFFDQIASYQILMDLLLEHNRFEDLLKVFDVVKKQQIQGMRFPRNVIVLVCAACYKMNTPESFKFACDLWSELVSVGHHPMRRAATFLAGLALNQNNPNIALEILSNMKQQNYVTVRNLKALALAELGRIEDTLSLLRTVLNADSTIDKRGTFSRDVIEKIQSIVKETKNDEFINEFISIEKYFSENGHYTEESIHVLLNSEIAANQQNLKQNAMYQQNSRMNNYYKGHSRNTSQQFNRFRRPGITDMH